MFLCKELLGDKVVWEPVLILIVLDHVLMPDTQTTLRRAEPVLILIILDHVLMRMYSLYAPLVLSRLNPYCIGSCSYAAA